MLYHPPCAIAITNTFFFSFLEKCGGELVTLRLACCPYVRHDAMETIKNVCTELEGAFSIIHRALCSQTQHIRLTCVCVIITLA